MIRVRRSLDLPYPQEQVFDFVADRRNDLLWHPEVRSVEKSTDGPVGPGTRFTARYRRVGRVEIEIVEYQRPWHLLVRASGAVKATYETRLEARAGTTHMETVAEAHPRGLGRLLAPLLRRRTERDFQRTGELVLNGLAAQTGQTRT